MGAMSTRSAQKEVSLADESSAVSNQLSSIISHLEMKSHDDEDSWENSPSSTTKEGGLSNSTLTIPSSPSRKSITSTGKQKSASSRQGSVGFSVDTKFSRPESKASSRSSRPSVGGVGGSGGIRLSTRNLDDLVRPDGPLADSRWRIGRIVNDPKVEYFILFIVVVNAFLITLASFAFVYDNPDRKFIFEVLDYAFLSAFTLESAMQLYYRGLWGPLNIFKDSWLVFDLFIVIISWSFGSVSIFRSLRVIRLLGKIATLRSLLTSIVRATPKLGAIFSLLLLVMYIFTVIFTMLFSDIDHELPTTSGYFSRLDKTAFTLVEFITMQWAKSCYEASEYYVWAPAIYVAYLSISGFIIFNLIIAVLCDVLSNWENENTEENERRMEQLTEMKHEVASLKEQLEKTDAVLESVMKELDRVKSRSRKKGLFG